MFDNGKQHFKYDHLYYAHNSVAIILWKVSICFKTFLIVSIARIILAYRYALYYVILNYVII